MSLFVIVSAQEPPKKKRKEGKKIEPAVVVDTTTVSISERAVIDSVAMEQRKQIQDLKEQIEIQKSKKKWNALGW